MVRFSLRACVTGIFSVIVSSNVMSDVPLLLNTHRIVSMESLDLQASKEFSDRPRLGHHLVIDLFGCNPEKIKHVETVEKVMVEAAIAARATIIAQNFHQFNPFGVSGAVVVSESHLAIHTWPEVDGYCAIDIFTCGKTDNFAALEVMKKGFEARGFVVVEIERGKQRSSWMGDGGTTVFREDLDPLNGLRTTVAIKDRLEYVESSFQRIEMYDTTAVGKMLVIDGIIQLTEYDNAAYHEMIVHVPLLAHPKPRKVLVVGGGDGGALAEIIKHKDVEEIVVCDIDPMVRAVAGKYFPQFEAAYKDPRVKAVYQDGTVFVKNFSNYFDVIIVDCTDFYGVAALLARKQFYEDIYKALAVDGVTVVQAESIYYDRDFIAGLYKQIAAIFPVMGYYNALVPTYPSGSIGFIFGSKKYGPMELLGSKDARIPAGLVYYNQEIHQASFALPNFFKDCLKK